MNSNTPIADELTIEAFRHQLDLTDYLAYWFEDES